jgi:predicted nucleic acid-binding Zn ribbon protein
MCVIIYAQKWALGFDPFVDWMGSEESKILEKGRQCLRVLRASLMASMYLVFVVVLIMGALLVSC